MVIHSSKYAWNDEHTTPSLNHVGIHHPVNPSQCFYKGIAWHSVIKEVFKAFIFDIIVCRVAQVRLGCVINNRCVCACVCVGGCVGGQQQQQQQQQRQNALLYISMETLSRIYRIFILIHQHWYKTFFFHIRAMIIEDMYTWMEKL